MSRSGSVPDEATREAARRLARVIVIGLPPTIVGQLIFVPPERVLLAIGLTAIGGAVALATLLVVTAGGPWRLLVAPVIALLDLTAVLCGALLPMGVDVAIILPFLGAVVLVAAFDGWQLRGGLLLAWLSGIAGSWLARSSPGVASIPHVTPVPFAIAMVAAGTAIGYAILGWAAHHWHATISEKDASMNAVR
ncbi:MAG: hypothetical protein ABSB75_05405, partial [Candidatus Limnocylindrales bacterium]